MSKIVAVRRGLKGELSQFKLDDGRVLNYDQAVDAIEIGTIEGCNVGKDKYGFPSIKSNRDNSMENNLTDLPNF